MAAPWEDLFDLLAETGDQLEALAAMAKENTAAVRRDDLLALDEVMKREQAAAMRLRSLDRRRGELLQALGLEGTRLSALPGRCPPDLRPRARAVSERLREQTDLYRAAAEVARDTLEIGLHEIEQMRAAGAGGEPRSLADIRA